MELRTARFSARFSPEKNNFDSLVNLVTGDEYLKSPPHAPLVELYALRDGQKEKLLPGPPRLEGGADRLRILYDRFGQEEVAMEILCTARGELLSLQATVENRCGLDLVELRMPCIGGMTLGRDFRQDVLIYPHHAGERTRCPVLAYGREKKDFWRASSVAFEDIYRREINYCGLASMSWMYYYDADNGFYIGSHDPRFPVTGVIADTSGVPEDPWMGFSFRKYHRIRPGQRWDAGEYLLAVTCEDWHRGARIYRDYIGPLLDFDHTPAFLQDEYALNQCYNFKRGGVVEHTFRDIPALYGAGEAWGVRHLFMAGWNRTGFDSFYPEYYPDMELGSAMELARQKSFFSRP